MSLPKPPYLSLYPLQSDGKTIAEIASRLVGPFGITLLSNASEANQVIETSTASASDSIAGYLNTICAQKNLILTHDAQGRLIITKYVATKPIAFLKSGSFKEGISLKCNGQAMHSEITVFKQASLDDTNAGQSEIRNPFITAFTTQVSTRNPFVPNYRPLVKEQTSNDEDDTTSATKTILSNELKNIQFSLSLPSWYINKRIIQPSQIVTVQSEALFITRPVNLFIESVEFTGTPESQTATLSLVLPEVYSGGTPQNIFE